MGNAVSDKQKRLLVMLNEFNKYCISHGIIYYVAFGTMLGTVRDKGFIPWDGDVDIMMNLEEYEKLLEHSKKEKIQNCLLVNYKTNKHIPSFFAKVFEDSVDERRLEEYPYIEIAVFTGAPKSRLHKRLMWLKSYINYEIFWAKKRIYSNNLKRAHSKIGFLIKILFFWLPSSICSKTFEKSIKKYNNSEEVFYLTSVYNEKKTAIKREWLSKKPIKMSFETIEVPVIPDFDLFLKKLYGDYMTPIRYGRYKKAKVRGEKNA